MMLIDKKGYPLTIQKSEFIEVVFENGFFKVPEDYLGGILSVDNPGEIKWLPLHQKKAIYIKESFLQGDSICRPRSISEKETTATGLRIWI